MPNVSDDAIGIFKRGDFLLEKIEEIHLYLFEINKKLNKLTECQL